MRLLTSVGIALALGLLVSLPALPAGAEDAAADPAEVSAPASPGAVNPEPYDPNLAKLNKGDCRKLARKIVHYADVAAQASDRGDDLWEETTVAHVDRLEARWNALCATEDTTVLRMVNAAITTASRLALKYFTMGYFD